MRRQLQIQNGIVKAGWEGTGAMPVPPDSSWTFIDVTDRPEAQVGMTYDADRDAFEAPPAPPDLGATVGPREFMLLFTAAERKSLRKVAATDEDVADFARLAEVPEAIRLKHPLTAAGLALLVARGALTAERAAAIQAGQPPKE